MPLVWTIVMWKAQPCGRLLDRGTPRAGRFIVTTWKGRVHCTQLVDQFPSQLLIPSDQPGMQLLGRTALISRAQHLSFVSIQRETGIALKLVDLKGMIAHLIIIVLICPTEAVLV